MITSRELFIGVIFLFIPKPWGLSLFYLLLLWVAFKIVVAGLFSMYILNTKLPGFICYKLQDAGHPSYQDEQCLSAGGAPYIQALKRRPSRMDLFRALMKVSVRGRYSIFLTDT